MKGGDLKIIHIPIETSRLKYMVLDNTYAKAVLAFYKENATFLEPWEPTKSTDYFTLAYHEKLLSDEWIKYEQGTQFKVWLFDKSDLHCSEIIGVVALNEIVRGAFQSCFVGYKMGQKFTGQGYMTEALGGVSKYAFDTLKLHRLEANIMPRNTASLTVAEKNHFQNEGLSPHYLKINGVWEDHQHMVLLNNDLE